MIVAEPGEVSSIHLLRMRGQTTYRASTSVCEDKVGFFELDIDFKTFVAQRALLEYKVETWKDIVVPDDIKQSSRTLGEFVEAVFEYLKQ
jgi:hypothetical protein